jgi:hypothetical protein
LTNRTLNIPNDQLNKNVKFDIFRHLKKMKGVLLFFGQKGVLFK